MASQDARYAVFCSFSEIAAGGGYYDAVEMRNMGHELTIIAYEMNRAVLSVLYGAPLRLRCENVVEAERLKAIELLASQDTPPGEIPTDMLRRVADLHTELTAVHNEIARHEPRLGHGDERPLA